MSHKPKSEGKEAEKKKRGSMTRRKNGSGSSGGRKGRKGGATKKRQPKLGFRHRKRGKRTNERKETATGSLSTGTTGLEAEGERRKGVVETASWVDYPFAIRTKEENGKGEKPLTTVLVTGVGKGMAGRRVMSAKVQGGLRTFWKENWQKKKNSKKKSQEKGKDQGEWVQWR